MIPIVYLVLTEDCIIFRPHSVQEKTAVSGYVKDLLIQNCFNISMSPSVERGEI